MEELPQIVWLRGDEPWCPDFALDAEAVMQRLGIKRTRLTQISGKELRVGRIRRGRYVAPVYRESDVESYAAWTRPTAAHLKSSQVLEDAARALAQQGEVVAERVHEDLAHLVSALSREGKERAREQERLADDRVQALVRRLDALEARAATEAAQNAARLAAQSAALARVETAISQAAFLQEAHNRSLAEQRAALERALVEVRGVAAAVDDTEDGVVALGGLIERLAAQLEERVENAAAAAAETSAALTDAVARLAAEHSAAKAAEAPASGRQGASAGTAANKLFSVYRRAARRRTPRPPAGQAKT